MSCSVSAILIGHWHEATKQLLTLEDWLIRHLWL